MRQHTSISADNPQAGVGLVACTVGTPPCVAFGQAVVGPQVALSTRVPYHRERSAIAANDPATRGGLRCS